MKYIVGFGNYSKNDDGIGLRVIEHICENNLDDGFAAIDIGNDGLNLLKYFVDETENIVVVDCALIGLQPGEIKVFIPDDVESKKILDGISTHEGDVIKLIELAKILGHRIPPIKIMAIQPECLKMEMRLSETLEKNLPIYVSKAIKLLN